MIVCTTGKDKYVIDRNFNSAATKNQDIMKSESVIPQYIKSKSC